MASVSMASMLACVLAPILFSVFSVRMFMERLVEKQITLSTVIGRFLIFIEVYVLKDVDVCCLVLKKSQDSSRIEDTEGCVRQVSADPRNQSCSISSKFTCNCMFKHS